MAVSPAASFAEQTSPFWLHLSREEQPVESLFPELRGRGLHTGVQPEPRLQAADGNQTLHSAALLQASRRPHSSGEPSSDSTILTKTWLPSHTQLQPCSLLTVTLCVCVCSQAGQQGQCEASYTSPGPIRLLHRGCVSTRAYRLRYCGRCSDSRCCIPQHTSTAEVTFRCLTGALLRRPVMMIHSCVCGESCPYGPFRNPALGAFRP